MLEAGKFITMSGEFKMLHFAQKKIPLSFGGAGFKY
jgi:hypothetical protein